MADRVYLGEAVMPVVIDEELSTTSTHPVENQAITTELGKKLENKATGTNALTIVGTAAATTQSHNVGASSSAAIYGASFGYSATASTAGTAIGTRASAGNYGVAIGSANGASSATTASGSSSVAIGYNAKATANTAIQIGTGTNSTAGTVQIKGTQVLDANGKIPTASLEADLTTKADTDLSNVTNTGKSTGAGWSMPSGTYVDLTLGASGSTYTAPANGSFVIRADGNTANTGAMLTNTNNGIGDSFTTGSGGAAWVNITCSALKGQDVLLDYSNLTTVFWFRFVYAEGSKSEAN